jgi:hypothetical protein
MNPATIPWIGSAIMEVVIAGSLAGRHERHPREMNGEDDDTEWQPGSTR